MLVQHHHVQIAITVIVKLALMAIKLHVLKQNQVEFNIIYNKFGLKRLFFKIIR